MPTAPPSGCGAGLTRHARARRQALLGGSETLARGSVRLEQGHRMLLETESLGNDVLVSLQRQRQQIKGAQCVRGRAQLRQSPPGA